MLNDKELVDALTLFKNISIGSKAPDFSLRIEKDKKIISKKLSELNGFENYVIVFWSTSCSHCSDEIPQIQKFIKSNKKNKIKVIAVALEDDARVWKEKTKYFPEFIHVLGLGKWENKIGDAYGVTETPTYFVLNREKQIVDKPEDFDALR